jgi:hypothetical protein
MSQFTQLNLGSSQGKPTGDVTPPASKNRKNTTALVVTVLATSLAGIFLLETSACSKSNSKSMIVKPEQPAITQQAEIPALAPVVPPAKTVKKVKRHKSTAEAYRNSDYGVSLLYPKRYVLKNDEAANIDWAGLGPVQMNFVQDGGGTLAAIELPKNSYPNTDFASAFFNVSVHPKLTSEECSQFMFPETTGNAAAKPANVKMGETEFSEIEASAGDATNQADAKYYHVFQNGACYEFALGVETARGVDAEVPQVDRTQVFNRLKRILSTVKIVAVEPTAVAATTAAVPTNEAISQK